MRHLKRVHGLSGDGLEKARDKIKAKGYTEPAKPASGKQSSGGGKKEQPAAQPASPEKAVFKKKDRKDDLSAG